MDGRISNFKEVASLCRYTVTDGKARGLDIIDCDNGKIRFLINVSRAADIMQLYHEGQNMSFISKNGFTGRDIPFMSRFEGGMLYTCGLDSVGGREGYELHGSFHCTPAEVTIAVCDESGITVEAIIRDTALFGKNLVMRRRIRTGIGVSTVTLEDTLVNEGYRDEEYCLLYHINLGYPMLDEGAELVADVTKCIPRTEWSRINESKMYGMSAPVAGEEESCYFLSMKTPEVSLCNRRIDKRFTVRYSGESLPHFVEWRSMASGDYALGLEPATTGLDDRFAYKTIAAGQSIKFTVSLSVEHLA